ncbi:MAG TPA: phosphoribosyltransferase family protein [Modestobacter sp.]|jgi:putative phosphoribosyl transferase|nr:phosphoribosyltransferase family protein [Modestobacter sp.]
MPFRDRADAGRQLARRLEHLGGEDVVVLGLPRGGVPVAAEVAASLHAPLDVIVVRKLRVPRRPELAMGAVGEQGTLVRNHHVVLACDVADAEFAEAEQLERAALAGQLRRLREVRTREPLEGRTAVVVDDGIATGATARAACAVTLAQGPGRVVLAAPVCAADAARTLAAEVAELVSVLIPDRFASVGGFYADFRATSEEQVVDLLRHAQPAL